MIFDYFLLTTNYYKRSIFCLNDAYIETHIAEVEQFCIVTLHCFSKPIAKNFVSWVVNRDVDRDRSPSPRKRRYSDDGRYDQEYSRREYYDDRPSEGRYQDLS